jgi:diacylglycerol kinase (ATP)
MNTPEPARPEPQTRRLYRAWTTKFRNAFRGIAEGIREQNSFRVHFSVAALAIVAAAGFQVSLVEWCILIMCIIGVLTAELFNSALEFMAKAVTDQHNLHLGLALDIGSAAVLVAAMGSVVVGGIVFVHRLGMVLGWWKLVVFG